MVMSSLIACRTLQLFTLPLHAVMEIEPAVTVSVYEHDVLYLRYFLYGILYLLYYEVIVDTYEHLDIGCLCPVYKVMCGKLKCTGYDDNAELDKCCGTDPVLVTSAKYHHYNRTLMKSQALKIVGCLIGKSAHLGKGKGLFLAVVIAPYKCTVVGLLLSPSVYDIKSEVKILGYIYFVICLEILV